MPSAAGKRVGRVLAGCSKPEAGDKPGLRQPPRCTDRFMTCNRHVSRTDMSHKHEYRHQFLRNTNSGESEKHVDLGENLRFSEITVTSPEPPGPPPEISLRF